MNTFKLSLRALVARLATIALPQRGSSALAVARLRRNRYALEVEELEQRQLCAVVMFTGALNTAWGAGPNWSTGNVPTNQDAVHIPPGKTCDVGITGPWDAASVMVEGTLNIGLARGLTVIDNFWNFGTVNVTGPLSCPEVVNLGKLVIDGGTVGYESRDINGNTIVSGSVTNDNLGRGEIHVKGRGSRILGDLSNHGDIYYEGSGTDLTVVQDYWQDGGATLNMKANPLSISSLDVGALAHLDGTLSIAYIAESPFRQQVFRPVTWCEREGTFSQFPGYTFGQYRFLPFYEEFELQLKVPEPTAYIKEKNAAAGSWLAGSAEALAWIGDFEDDYYMGSSPAENFAVAFGAPGSGMEDDYSMWGNMYFATAGDFIVSLP